MYNIGKKEKEYLYVGHYIDKRGRYILKIGTTNNLERRKKEHNFNYRKTREFALPENNTFEYDWTLKLSKYNTLRYEDRTRKEWQESGIGNFIRNDRFYCPKKPQTVKVTIRKTYIINLGE